MRVAQRELLRHTTAEGDAEDVGVGQAERVEEMRSLAGESVRAQRHEPGRRVAGARGVVGDRLEAAGVELALERRPHLDVAAEPHDQQDRRSFARDGDPQQVPVDAGEGPQLLHDRWT